MTALLAAIHTIREYPPVALGMCLSYAAEQFRGDPRLVIASRLLPDEEAISDLLERNPSASPVILLFSNYMWNRKANLALSRAAKAKDARVVTIHGGPDTPAYPEAARLFLESEPHVDFIVAGEGEESLRELVAAILSGRQDYEGVEGLRYRRDGQFFQTPARKRATDVNRFPSPYLTGFFDGEEVTRWQSATIETYRGCPYGCTFCDWGSSTASKIRMFDLERVFAELEWIGRNRIDVLWIADSNFGITERDVAITRKVCEVKRQFGYPKMMLLTFAKNVKSRVIDIVQMMVAEQLIGTGIISLQTTDPDTLSAIRRSNIKTSEYEKLRRAFARRDLPLNVELMMALPGATIGSFKNDLLYHFDMPIEVNVHRTMMLPNSPMAHPDYREAHRLEADSDSRIVSTATMSPEDIETADVICRLFYGVHRFGILRHLLRWLQWERAISPLEVLHDLVREAKGLLAFPHLAAFVRDARAASEFDLITAVIGFREQHRSASTWAEVGEQFIAWASVRYGLGPNPALLELARVQARLMPASSRRFPDEVAMVHDVPRWYSDRLNGASRPLGDYGPAILRVDDPLGISDLPCFEGMAKSPGHAWELDYEMLAARRRHATLEIADPGKSGMTDGASQALTGIPLPS